MEKLAKYIVSKMKNSNSWNQKFYQHSDNTVSIFIDNEKIFITEMWNEIRNQNETQCFYTTRFLEIFRPMLEEMIDRELGF